MCDNNSIIIYQPDDNIRLEVKLKDDAVWLNRQQISVLFARDIKTIGKHINNALREELAAEPVPFKSEVDAKNATTQIPVSSVVAKFATTAADGKTYQVEYYSLDVILSVGYRVKSRRGILFRQWANRVLKEHLLHGYSISNHLIAMQQQMDNRFSVLEQEVKEHGKQIDFLVRTKQKSSEEIFPAGCIFDAWNYVSGLVRNAQKRIILIDNYCDERVLSLLTKRQEGVVAIIYSRYSLQFKTDLEKHNKQYSPIEFVQLSQKSHDRFLIIDDDVYLLGSSVKDMGNGLCAITQMQATADEIIQFIK